MHIRAKIMRSKELPIELRDKTVSRLKQTKQICCIEGSQEHVASIIINGRSLEQPVGPVA